MNDCPWKYKIGDKVYSASIERRIVKSKCPDCNDSGKWSIVSPAGQSILIPCPRCCPGFQFGHVLSLQKELYVPKVDELTIGSRKYDSNNSEPAEYMCVETGVGSGTIHRESNLYGTFDDALRAAAVRAEAKNTEEKPSRGSSADLANSACLSIVDALDQKSFDRVREMSQEFNEFINELEECEDMDQVEALLQRKGR